MAVFQILLGFLFCALTSLALGVTALRLLNIQLRRLECACLGYVLGSAVTSMLTLVIALAGFVHRGVFYGIGLLAASLIVYQFRWLRSLLPAPVASIPFFFRYLFLVVWIVYGVLYFRFALAPETSPDGTVYHLGLTNLWFHAHRMFRIDDVYAALTQGMEMLFLFAFTLGHHSAAALVHFSFLMLLPVLVLLYAARFGIPQPAAVFAALVVFTTPLIGWDGSVAYNDVALSAVTFVALYFFELWRRGKQPGFLTAAAFLSGFAVAIKYTGVFVVLWLLALTAWELRRNGRQLIRTVLAAGLVALILPAPYFIRNWVWYQNPIAFFGDSVFRNPNFHVQFERDFIQGQVELNGVKWRDIPKDLTIGGTHLPESFGPIYVLAPLALLGLALPRSRPLVIAALFAMLAYPGNKSARFLIPAVPLLFLALSYAMSRIPASQFLLAALTILQAVLCWPQVVDALHTPVGKRIYRVSWDAALRREPEDHYLTYNLAPYLMARRIDKFVPDGEPVMAPFGHASQAYTTHFIMEGQRSGNIERNFSMLYSNSKSEQENQRRWTVSLPATRVRAVRVTQHATSQVDWMVNEIHLWSKGRLVPMPAGVHVNAFPNPWDMKFAIDGNEATFWRSWEHMRPGMWLDLRFDQPQAIDRIDFISQDGQWDSRPELTVQNDFGQWVSGSGNWYNDPPVDQRKNVTAELKREGIHYLLIDNSAYWPERFNNDPAVWGMTLVTSTAFSRLYRID